MNVELYVLSRAPLPGAWLEVERLFMWSYHLHLNLELYIDFGEDFIVKLYFEDYLCEDFTWMHECWLEDILRNFFTWVLLEEGFFTLTC